MPVPDGGKAILWAATMWWAQGSGPRRSGTVRPIGWGHGDGVAQTYLTFDGAEPTQVMMARILMIFPICRIASDKTG